MNRVLLITGDGLRHRYTSKVICSNLNLVGIVSEKKPSIESYTNTTKELTSTILNHFKNRDTVESELLGNVPSFPDRDIIHIERGEVNSDKVFKWIKTLEPDFLILYGSGIIRNPILEEFKDRIINLHLGLSPYYRGSGTNFWPLVDNVPECVGATIHVATLDVDAGNIISRIRPNISINDTVHHIGTKALISGLNKMVEVIPKFLIKSSPLISQNLKIGKVYYRKDFSEDSLIKLKTNFENDMLKNYLVNKLSRDKKYPI